MSGHRRETSPRRAMVFDSSTIGRRVARILALPAAVVLVLLAVVASGLVQGLTSARATGRSVELTLAVQGLVHQLQTERGVAAAVLGGNPSFKNELASARSGVDAQRTAVASLADGGGAAESRLRTALAQLDGLPAIRGAVDASTAGGAATFAFYTQRINSLITLDLGLDRVSDDEMRRSSQALRYLVDLSEATAQERAFLNGVFSAGGFAKGEFVQFAGMRTARDAALAGFRRLATPEENASATYVFGTGAARTSAAFEQVALAAADGRHVIVNPQAWWSGQTTVLDDLLQLQNHMGSKTQLRAHDLQTSALRNIAVLVAVVLLCLGGSVALAILASLAITRPLAALADEADAVSSQRLPDAMRRVLADPEGERTPPEPVRVPARATREITSVASALDRLQSAAFGLATEQAMQRQRVVTSLANLGRRNQNLIRRQLGFITRLEREEMDPNALSNLFELDHLATRMRRNAASLLVLVGESGPRQWSSPVAMADVIRAAVSEVEEYRRVALRRVDDVLVAGAAVGNVVHLLSELIENALTFSPPDSEVEVQGRLIGESYLVAITDQGIGMSGEELRIANARLQGQGDFIAAPTKFLGHFVVGELARNAGIDVELVPSPVIGVTARVTLPPSLLTGRVAVEAGGNRGSSRSLPPRAKALDPAAAMTAAVQPAAVQPATAQPAAAAVPHLTAVASGSIPLPASAGIPLPPPPAAATAAPPVAPPAAPAAASATGPSGPDSVPVPVVSAPASRPPVFSAPASGAIPAPVTASASADAASQDAASSGSLERVIDLTAFDVPAEADARPVTSHLTGVTPAPGTTPPGSTAPASTASADPARAGDDPAPEKPATGAIPLNGGATGAPGGTDPGDSTPGDGTPGDGAQPAAAKATWSPWDSPPSGQSAWDRWSLDIGGPPSAMPPASPSPTLVGSAVRSGMAGPDGDDGERTRNGLRKRTPRTQRPAGAASPAASRPETQSTRTADRPDAVGDSPAEIRSRLLSLRSGIQRGQGAGTGSATPTWPDRSSPTPEETP